MGIASIKLCLRMEMRSRSLDKVKRDDGVGKYKSEHRDILYWPNIPHQPHLANLISTSSHSRIKLMGFHCYGAS